MRSRVLLVPFSLPSTGPTTEEEFDAFEEFKQSLEKGRFSSAVGWVVKQREVFLQSGRVFVQSMQQQIRGSLESRIRNTTGWASCLFFLNQVKDLYTLKIKFWSSQLLLTLHIFYTVVCYYI